MTTSHHSPIVFGASASPATVNNPLGQLDAAIIALNTAIAGTALPITTINASSAAGQAVVRVTSTAAFIVGQSIWIGAVGGVFEIRTIASIQAGVSLTTTVNLSNTYGIGTIVSASPQEMVEARGASATLKVRLDAVDAAITALAPSGMYTYAAGAGSLNVAANAYVFPAWGLKVDPGAGFTVTPNTRWVVPAGKAGFYTMIASVLAYGTTAGQAAGNLRIFEILKNGSQVAGATCAMASATTGTFETLAWAGPLAVGDYLEIRGKPYTTNGDLLVSHLSILRGASAVVW